MSPICFLLTAISLALIQAARHQPKIILQEGVPASKSKKDIYDSLFYRSEWSWDTDVRPAVYQNKPGKTRAPGYARYWSELTEKQKSAIESLHPFLHDEEKWNEAQAAGDYKIVDDIADSLGEQYWAALNRDERTSLNHLGFAKWSWNEMVKTRKSLRRVSNEEKQAYKGMRKCTKWDVTKSHVFSEERFEKKIGFGLEVKTHGNCQQRDEFFFVNFKAPTWAVYVYPKDDYNNAFCIDEWFCARALTVANFFSIAFVRVDSPEEATTWLKKQKETGMRIGHLVFAGHGDPYSLQFGHGSLQTGKDAESLEMLAQSKEMLVQDASVFLDSCKTGSTDIESYTGDEENLILLQEETLHSFVGRQLAGHHVWGSKISFSNSQLKVSFSPHGFHAIIDECGQFCDQGIDNQAHHYLFANTTAEWAFEYGYSCDNLVTEEDSEIETPQDCLNACKADPQCVAFTFRPEVRQEDFRCSFSADCDATRAPVEILITEGRNKIRARILQKHAMPGLAKFSEVKLRYSRGTFGTLWVFMNKEKQQLLHQDGVKIKFRFKTKTKDQIIFNHKPKGSRKEKTYWAHILDDQRPARTLVLAGLEVIDTHDLRARLLDETGRYLIKYDAIKGNYETRYAVDHTAPTYTKMSAEEDIVFTFLRPT